MVATRLPRPWHSPGKNTAVGCHFLLQCMKVRSESEVAQSCPTLSDPMDCSLPGSSVHGIFQARVLEWGAIAFSRPLFLLQLKFARLLFTLLYFSCSDFCISQTCPAASWLTAPALAFPSTWNYFPKYSYEFLPYFLSLFKYNSSFISISLSWIIFMVLEI